MRPRTFTLACEAFVRTPKEVTAVDQTTIILALRGLRGLTGCPSEFRELIDVISETHIEWTDSYDSAWQYLEGQFSGEVVVKAIVAMPTTT